MTRGCWERRSSDRKVHQPWDPRLASHKTSRVRVTLLLTHVCLLWHWFLFIELHLTWEGKIRELASLPSISLVLFWSDSQYVNLDGYNSFILLFRSSIPVTFTANTASNRSGGLGTKSRKPLRKPKVSTTRTFYCYSCKADVPFLCGQGLATKANFLIAFLKNEKS